MFNNKTKELEEQLLNQTLQVTFLKNALERVLGEPIESLVDFNNLNTDSVDLLETHIESVNKNVNSLKNRLKDARAETKVWMNGATELQEEYDDLLASSEERAQLLLEDLEASYEDEIQELKDKIVDLEAKEKSKFLEEQYKQSSKLYETQVLVANNKAQEMESQATKWKEMVDDLQDKLLQSSVAKDIETKELLNSIENVAKEFAKNSNPKLVLANAEVMTGDEK